MYRLEEQKFSAIQKGTFFCILVLIILGLTPLLWFTPKHIIDGGDIDFPLDPVDYWERNLFAWDSDVDTGRDYSQYLPYLPISSFHAFLTICGVSLITLQKISFVILFTLPGLTMYYLLRVLFRNEQHSAEASLVGAIFYQFNVYLILIWTDVLDTAICAYAGVPLLLAYYERGVSCEKVFNRYLFLFSLGSFLTMPAAVNPPIFVLAVLIILFFVISRILLTVNGNRRELFSRKLSFTLILIGTIITLHLWWILPYGNYVLTQSKAGGFNMPVWVEGTSTQTSLLRAIRILGTWFWYDQWQGDPYVIFSHWYRENLFFVVASFISPLLAGIAVFFGRKKNVIFFTALTIIGIIFSLGTHPPLGIFYNWLLERVPGFWIFRSPWLKFPWLIVIGYSYLIAVSVTLFYGWLKRTFARVIPLSALLLLSLVQIFYCLPFVQGKMYPRQEERRVLPPLRIKVPDYVWEASQWINSQPDDSRVLLLPWQKSILYRWGYGSSDSPLATHLVRRPVIFTHLPDEYHPAQDDNLTTIFASVLYENESSKAANILSLLQGEYILQRDDIQYDFYGGKDSPSFISESLSRQVDILKESEHGEWKIYRSRNVLPHIYSPAKIWLIDGQPGDLRSLHLLFPEDEKLALLFTSQMKDGDYHWLSNADNLVLFDVKQSDSQAEVEDMEWLRAVCGKEQRYILRQEKEFVVPCGGKYLLRGYYQVFPENILQAEPESKTTRFTSFSGRRKKDLCQTKEYLSIDDKEFEVTVCESIEKKGCSLLGTVDLTRGKHYFSRIISMTLGPSPHTLRFEGGRDIPHVSQFKLVIGNKELLIPAASFSRGNVAINSPDGITFYGTSEDQIILWGGSDSCWAEYDFYFKASGAAELWVRYSADDSRPVNIYLDGKLIVRKGVGQVTGGWNVSHSKWEKQQLENPPLRFQVAELHQETETGKESVYVPVTNSQEDRSKYAKAEIHIPPQVTYKRLNPATYKVSVVTEHPCFIVFNETYNEGWKLYRGGKETGEHFMANGYANGYYLDETGSCELILRYRGQQLFTLGRNITIGFIVFILIGWGYRSVCRKWRVL